MEKVSIIMSAYNAEKYISKAINSVFAQTYPNIELVITEDKSTDSTLEIIQRIIKDNPDRDIKLIVHEENLGAGWSRSDGIKASVGEYTAFLDSDDWLDKECIETLVKAAKETGADIVTPGYRIFSDKIIVVQPDKRVVVEGGDKFYQDSSDACRFLGPNLIKATLWSDVEYSKRRYCEDSPTFIQLIAKAKKRCILDYAGYNYLQVNTSLTHTVSYYKEEIYSILCLLDSYEVFGDIITLQAFLYKLECISKIQDKTGIDGNEIDEIVNKITSIIRKKLTK